MCRSSLRSVGVILTCVVLAACAPASPASPTTAPAKSEVTTAPAKPVDGPVAKPAEAKPAPTAAVAKPAEAKPAASPAAKAGFDEKAVANFYRGKTVKIVVGFAAGGGYDSYSRMLAKHMPRYIPGNPSMIVENKGGAGSMVAANALYNTDPKDGTVIGNFGEGLVLLQAQGADGIQYDATKFNWLGSTVKTAYSCMARVDTGITSINDIIGGGKELVIGTQAPGTGVHDAPAVMNAVLGTRFKLVPGYDGVAKIRLAFQQREVDGFCQTWESILGSSVEFLEGSNPLARMLIIMGSEVPNHPLLKGVPAAEKLAKDEEGRLLLKAVNAPQEMTKPYALPPGVPAERVAALRQALASTFAGKEFLVDAEKAKLNVDPGTGEAVEKLVRELLSTPPAVIAKLKEILK